jgi:hypothetical protein
MSYTDPAGKVWRVVPWTPYGREETVSILLEYMRRDHAAGVVDEWILYMNTDDHQQSDRDYAYHLAETYPWIRTVERPSHLPVKHPKQMNTGHAYLYFLDPDTVYIRFDDDIVYVHEDAISNLVAARIQAGDRSIVAFPIIWHNAVCSWHLQTHGKIPHSYGVVGAPYCMDPVGWADAKFAERIHNLLLEKIHENRVHDLFLHHTVQLPVGLQFSVSCFAATSDLYRNLPEPGFLGHHAEEENWHTVDYPNRTGLPNFIVPDALVAHLSFFPHSDYIRRETDILPRYRHEAKRVAAKLDGLPDPNEALQ